MLTKEWFIKEKPHDSPARIYVFNVRDTKNMFYNVAVREGLKRLVNPNINYEHTLMVADLRTKGERGAIFPFHAFFPNFHVTTFKAIEQYVPLQCWALCLEFFGDIEVFRNFLDEHLGTPYGLFNDIPNAMVDIVAARLGSFIDSKHGWALDNETNDKKSMICSEAAARCVAALRPGGYKDIVNAETPSGHRPYPKVFGQVNPFDISTLMKELSRKMKSVFYIKV